MGADDRGVGPEHGRDQQQATSGEVQVAVQAVGQRDLQDGRVPLHPARIDPAEYLSQPAAYDLVRD
ncbi:hypothetical protein BIV24_28925 [Streptomyces colonosanans]|uniref:Uncharacterized protein n=1 Tax=Streptomyces colonosanans TaxID=1428652 RepID=A0A1S2NVN4_9ACTN|nr:hypothetical protein BIV24_28925 [Streptomyces colonosanans]